MKRDQFVLMVTDQQFQEMSAAERERIQRQQDLLGRFIDAIQDGDTPVEAAGALITLLAGLIKGYGGPDGLEHAVTHLRMCHNAVVVSTDGSELKYPDGERPIQVLGLGKGGVA